MALEAGQQQSAELASLRLMAAEEAAQLQAVQRDMASSLQQARAALRDAGRTATGRLNERVLPQAMTRPMVVAAGGMCTHIGWCACCITLGQTCQPGLGVGAC